MTSRVLGMVREMVYAGFMGNTWVASAFTLAFQVPNLFRRLLGEGDQVVSRFRQQRMALELHHLPRRRRSEPLDHCGDPFRIVVVADLIPYARREYARLKLFAER